MPSGGGGVRWSGPACLDPPRGKGVSGGMDEEDCLGLWVGGACPARSFQDLEGPTALDET